MTKVAIITRTKDRPLFLRRAITSVGSQTFDDYVHVIVNDGGDNHQVDALVESLDDTVKAKTKLFHRLEPSNAPDTIFNESIDRVESMYVVIHDDDDTWHPDFLARTVAVLDAGAKGVLARTDKVTEKLLNGKVATLNTEQYQPDVKVVNLYRQCVDNQMTPIAFIYRRDAYEDIGKYDTSLPVVGDWEFGIRFLLKYDVDFVDPGFALANYHHRKDADNSFTTHDHRYYFNKVANRYLRQELAEGKLGPGYIISKIRYDQSYMARAASKMLPSFVAQRLKKRVQT